jgi:hypothetical protein
MYIRRNIHIFHDEPKRKVGQKFFSDKPFSGGMGYT